MHLPLFHSKKRLFPVLFIIVGALLFLVAVLPAAPLFFVTDSAGVLHDSIPKASLQRPFWTQGNACLGPKVRWEELESGLSLGTLYLGRPDTTVVCLRLLRMERDRFILRLLGGPGKGNFIENMVKGEGAVAGINGGYFYIHERTTELRPLGLTVKGGQKFSQYRGNYSGTLISDNAITRFFYRTQPLGDPPEALQSFPMLLFEGRIPEEVRDPLNGKLEILRRHRRSAVGEDREGRLCFIASGQGVSFQEMGFIAGALGLKHCLALDGGSSTQMCAGSGALSILPGLDRVPVGLGVFRK
ncbi:MAG: phosphodiester glycosidase family protein [Fibrobacterota bacterium]